MKDIKKIFETKTYTHILTIVAIFLIAWVIFATGIFIGYHKATFSRDWDDTYHEGMMNPNSPLAPFTYNTDGANPHGTMGEIISIHMPVIMIKGSNNAEQVVIISSSTIIRLLHNIASTSAIQSGQFGVVIGEPDNRGEIQASFIRIVPPPPEIIRTGSLIMSTSTIK